MKFVRTRTMACVSALLLAHNASAVSVVTEWNEELLQAIRTSRPAPPAVARSLAVVHTCMYDAWVAYDDKAEPTMPRSKMRRPEVERTEANKKKAISFAAYRALVDQFPTEKAKFDARMAAYGYDAKDDFPFGTEPQNVGNKACAAVLSYRHADGSNQLGDLAPGRYADYTGYQPANTATELKDPNRWQPLEVPNAQGVISVQRYATPHWGRVKPFAIRPPEHYVVAPPARFGTPEYEEQAMQVVQYTAALDDRAKAIAEYWADGPSTEFPPGHWNLFAQFVSKRDKLTLDEDVKLFFALNNAVMDAGILAWDIKRRFDSVRPISAIRFLFKGRQIPSFDGQTVAGENWHPYQPKTFPTPPFAEFVSGHSLFSGSAAYLLKAFTGSDYFGHKAVFAKGSSLVQPGVAPTKDITLYWGTFSEAADEAGFSRRYGGIHFYDGDMVSRTLAKQVGEAVWERSLKLFRGSESKDSAAESND